MTFIADSACSNLPAELRTRTYAASIQPDHSGTSFSVTARGGDFPAGLNTFYLNVAGNVVNVSLGDHTDPGVAERVAPDTYFAFNGWAVTSVDTPVSTIATAFQGWIDVCVNPAMGARYDCTPGPTIARVRCEAGNHQLILRRQ